MREENEMMNRSGSGSAEGFKAEEKLMELEDAEHTADGQSNGGGSTRWSEGVEEVTTCKCWIHEWRSEDGN